jgi:hypothetical protein
VRHLPRTSPLRRAARWQPWWRRVLCGTQALRRAAVARECDPAFAGRLLPAEPRLLHHIRITGKRAPARGVSCGRTRAAARCGVPVRACTHAAWWRRDRARAAAPAPRVFLFFFYTNKTARKWHIDCKESQDSPALRNKGLKVVHVKQCKAGRLLFEKTEITRFHPTDVF